MKICLAAWGNKIFAKVCLFLAVFLVLVYHGMGQSQKAPAYPLITHDPYFSIWSVSDTLNHSTTKHWTGADHSLTGAIKVDGKIYNILGMDEMNYETVLPASDDKIYACQYTESAPAEAWMEPGFNDKSWITGKAPFTDKPSQEGTAWHGKNIWVRRAFVLDRLDFNKLYLKINHDDDAEVYLNGEKIYSYKGWLSKFQYFPISDATKEKLRKGENVLAVHVANTAGGAWLDAGIVNKRVSTKSNSLMAVQKSVDLKATQTIYHFTCGPVDATLSFTSPLLMDDLALLSRPVSYISYSVQSTDGKAHDVQIYFGASGNIAANNPGTELTTQKYTADGLTILRAGTRDQPVLKKSGDDLRIDWGYMYVAVPASAKAHQYITTVGKAASSFKDASVSSTSTKGKNLVLNTVIHLGKVGTEPIEQFILLGYDDLYSIQYFGQNLKPWWKNDPLQTIEKQLALAASGYKDVLKKCQLFNDRMKQDAADAGGEKYADLCVLAYRQSIAAHKLVKSPQGEILFLSKENFSNGCINTVDVTYPSAPLFLIYNPELLKGMLNGIFYYSESTNGKSLLLHTTSEPIRSPMGRCMAKICR
jgi:hypothetical protein